MKNAWMKIAAIALVCAMGAGMYIPTLAEEVPAVEVQIEETVVETPVEAETAPAEEEVQISEDTTAEEESVVEATVAETNEIEEVPVVEEICDEEPETVEAEIDDAEGEQSEVIAEEAPVEEISENEDSAMDMTVEEDEASEEQTETEIDYSALKVIIKSDFENVIMPGDMIELEGILIGFEGLEYTVQWQYDCGNGWQDIDGANELIYRFEANEENLNYQWRLTVTL